MNIYHKSLLYWNFQRDVDQGKVIVTEDVFSTWGDSASSSSKHRSEPSFQMSSQPQQTIQYMENDLRTKISKYVCITFSIISIIIWLSLF